MPRARRRAEDAPRARSRVVIRVAVPAPEGAGSVEADVVEQRAPVQVVGRGPDTSSPTAVISDGLYSGTIAACSAFHCCTCA